MWGHNYTFPLVCSRIIQESGSDKMWNVKRVECEAFKISLVITRKWKWYKPSFFLLLQVTFKGSCCHPFTSIVRKQLSLWTQYAGFRLTVPEQCCTSSNLLFIYLNGSAPETQACPAFWQSGLITVMLLWQVLLKAS